MKFSIRCTSDWRTTKKKGPPTDGAQQATVTFTRFGGEKGTKDIWEVEIPDLAALVALAQKEGEIIIRPLAQDEYEGGYAAELEIYDDYRE